jgi:DNA-directed RNA polymerase subunit L
MQNNIKIKIMESNLISVIQEIMNETHTFLNEQIQEYA